MVPRWLSNMPLSLHLFHFILILSAFSTLFPAEFQGETFPCGIRDQFKTVDSRKTLRWEAQSMATAILEQNSSRWSDTSRYIGLQREKHVHV